jgi:Mrp family chromosome partitioning ATPase
MNTATMQDETMAGGMWDSDALTEPVAYSCFSPLIEKLFDRAQRLSPSAVMVTSPHRKAGVSFICSNIAAELAQRGERVLLADSHALLALRMSPARSVAALCRRVGENLWVLGMAELAGRHAIAEIAGSSAVGTQLRELERVFSFVLIDAPALADEMDAKLLATVVYGTVLVARANQTRDEDLERESQALTTFGGRVLGSVFNAH